jgi:hypothetical protein
MAEAASAASSRHDQPDNLSSNPANAISVVVSLVKADNRADSKARVVNAAVSRTEASPSAVNRAAEIAEIANGITGPFRLQCRSKFTLEMPPSSAGQSAATYT